ncbi:MAG: hypothetical protein ACI4R8_05145 [Candidatus Caccovivens sp.]
MNLTELIKSQDFFQKLVKKKQSGSFPNAMLFFCEDELTSQKALVLTALLLEYEGFDFFDENSAEFHRIESGVDLDIKVYPKNNDKLLVADSNEIVAEGYIKPVNLPNKVFIINNFDRSTEEAQNKLLKILEEPPKNVYFLLSAKNTEKVLPTIKSRCDKVKILPLSDAEISAVVKDNLACVLGDGYLGKTISLAKNEDLKSVANFAVSLVTELKNSKQVLKFSKRFVEMKDNMDLILQALTLCLEDIIKIKCECENLCKIKMYTDRLKDVEPEFSVQALCEISKLVSNLREKFEFNANVTVALDNFLLKMLEVKYLCK